MSGDWGYGTAFKIFVWGYLVGGLTLVPVVLVVAWLWGTIAVDQEGVGATTSDDVATPEQRRQSNGSTNGKREDNVHLGVGIDEEILEKLKGRTHEPDVCAGYFAVCREYVPGGVNGKPPDRTTPAGAVVSMESPSVYQSMYRSIFDRNKTMTPTIEGSNARSKKARNVFYVVLRLGHLMLYDNEDQLEVRHVISLTYYKVDIYAGGERIPEGELWIKRNCIRLIQKLDSNTAADAKGFYLFSDNCSEKEDFYHAMLHAQENQRDPSAAESPCVPLKFDTPDLVKLVQQLHASEENLHTRWINALIGRVFLALYKTSQVKEFIATKINKKIARVPKPAIISSVELRKVDMGTLPPFVTNPKLKELTVDGDLVVEADVSYKGNFRIEIMATVRIDLGARFKAREVTIVLATVLKKLDGHILIRVKPPPSNRLWMTFETPPRMEFSLEPIVSSRQITYGVVLRAIEGRIREVVNETLVLPNWDDLPFTDTFAQVIRGGIWEEDTKDEEEEADKIKQDDATLDSAMADAEKLDDKADSASSHFSISSSVDSDELGTGMSSSADYKFSSASPRPRPMRSSSSAAQVKVDSLNASAEMAYDRTLTPTSVRSLPITSPQQSPLRPNAQRQPTESSTSSSEDVSAASISGVSTKSASIPNNEQAHSRTRSRDLSAQEIAAAAAAAAGATNMNNTKKQTINQSLNSATAAARNWLAAKHNPQSSRTNNPTGSKTSLINNNRPPTSEGLSLDGEASQDPRPHLHSHSKSHTEPMGRGQPLPPPGTPLPLPPKTEKRQTWATTLPAAATSTFANLTKRKPLSTTPILTTNKSTEDDLDAPKSSASSLHHHLLPSPPQLSDQILDPLGGDGEDLFRRKPLAAHNNNNTTTTTSVNLNSNSNSNPEMQMPRRKSSAASISMPAAETSSNATPPPLPKRRQRQQSLNLGAHQRRASEVARPEDQQQREPLLVVEAPPPDPSEPSSPVVKAKDGHVWGERGVT
ncbi:hypothetical protein BDW02DRAFT_515879 [Decorospora gaudefroyi]|uniref:SMP-LTD domain-containing protein n=1 Tax=Decorospora gaudefroyi TaxID=184978 RepID=A0A6A5KTY5_9PLEO|nr:hypothetical protein BDW02DRAFT_515879 [Decorospora gaudefroyi]